MNNSTRGKTRWIVGVALFTGMVIVLQLLGSFIHFGMFSISLVLVPIVVGAAVYGAAAGAWLGFVFGVTVLLSGDAAAFLVVNPAGTIAVVLIKGIASGFCGGLAFRAFAGREHFLGIPFSEIRPLELAEKIRARRMYEGVILAAIVTPVVNTGIFLIGCFLFFMPTIEGWAEAFGFGSNVAGYIVSSLVGMNFVFELLFNVLLGPVITRLIRLERRLHA